uniref:uncharacterized protein LOC120327198 n=1 Tax=Styela clava TaxID=7725 RepID=UPI001939E540|nr:uncharacterized protein LOC120327198 [Styela clava]
MVEEKNNSGNTTELVLGIPLERKILYQSVAITLSVMVVYVTFALLQYNWVKSGCRQEQERRSSSMKQKGPKESGGTSDSSNSNSQNSCRSKTSSARNSRILRNMCVTGSVLVLIRLLAEQIEILPSSESRLDCRDYQIAMVVTYALAVTVLYGILWYRVRVFLSHPAMRHLGSRVLTVILFIVLIVIILASGVNMAMFLVTTISVDQEGGCQTVSPGDVLSNSARFGILTVCTVVSQASLLGLFLYPLVRHSATMQAAKINTPQVQRKENESVRANRTMSFKSTLSPGTLTRKWRSRNSSKRKKREQALLKIIRRVMITAIVCALSDIFCGLIVRLVVEEPRVVTNLIFDVNIVINLACVLMSFKDWRVRLFPCCVQSQKSKKGDKSDKRPASDKEPYIPQHPTSSPPIFSSRDSTGSGVCRTSESGINSVSPRAVSQDGRCYRYSNDVSLSEDYIRPV